MQITTYIIDLSPDGQNRYRHRHVLDKKQIVEFSIQFETWLENKWHVIVRYDTAHGYAHRDVLHPDGTETKTHFPHWDYTQTLTNGERDLKQNWKMYRQEYLAKLTQSNK